MSPIAETQTFRVHEVAKKNVPIEFENFVIKHYPENSPSGQLCEKFS